MNKNQVQGEVRELAGKVQEQVGKWTGSKAQQVKGIQKQVVGEAEKMQGNVKEVMRAAAGKN
jgi:uncharacterized protein YjbJ (UPF0337 family)